MSRGEAPGRRRAGGFTYIGLLALIVLIGILLAAAGQVSSTTSQREREIELLYIGHAYRDAIGQYYAATRRYPAALEQLVQVGDGPRSTRFLRQLYRDPMTNAVDWVLLPAPDGGIIGIASSSKRAPLKHAGFDVQDEAFEDAVVYTDWAFSFAASAPVQRLKNLKSH